MLQEIKAKVKDEHREDLQGYLLNLFLQSQNPSLQRPLQRRERRDPKGKRGKLMLAGMRITLQKMELTKQTRHIKLKVLEMRSPAGPGLQGRFWGVGPHRCLGLCSEPRTRPGVSLQARGPQELRTPGPCRLRLDSFWLQRQG